MPARTRWRPPDAPAARRRRCQMCLARMPASMTRGRAPRRRSRPRGVITTLPRNRSSAWSARPSRRCSQVRRPRDMPARRRSARSLGSSRWKRRRRCRDDAAPPHRPAPECEAPRGAPAPGRDRWCSITAALARVRAPNREPVAGVKRRRVARRAVTDDGPARTRLNARRRRGGGSRWLRRDARARPRARGDEGDVQDAAWRGSRGKGAGRTGRRRRKDDRAGAVGGRRRGRWGCDLRRVTSWQRWTVAEGAHAVPTVQATGKTRWAVPSVARAHQRAFVPHVIRAAIPALPIAPDAAERANEARAETADLRDCGQLRGAARSQRRADGVHGAEAVARVSGAPRRWGYLVA